MFSPRVRKLPWRRKWQPTPVFLPGKSHRQRSLAGYSPWDCQESDMTDPMSAHTHTHTRRHSFKPKVPEIQRYRMGKERGKKREPA